MHSDSGATLAVESREEVMNEVEALWKESRDGFQSDYLKIMNIAKWLLEGISCEFTFRRGR